MVRWNGGPTLLDRRAYHSTMRKIMAVVVGVGLLVAAGCTPAVTITASASRYVDCGTSIPIKGTVTPSDAMTSVVVQRTTNGKWVDWLWYETGDSDEEVHKLVARMYAIPGEWSITPRAHTWKAGETIHLRVRASAAAGGTAVVSPSFYVTTKVGPSGRCPTGLFVS